MFDCSSTCGHRDIHVLAHSFPARRSSDLPCPVGRLRWSPRWNSPPRQRPPPSFRAARRRMSDLPIVGFDSASAFLRAMANYLRGKDFPAQIGREHVCTPVINANLICRLLLETTQTQTHSTFSHLNT